MNILLHDFLSFLQKFKFLNSEKKKICGIDVCHDKISKRGSVAGFVATVNRDVNSFFSKTIILQREADLVTGLTQCMKESIQYFNKLNSVLPANIIVYRDGVGDSQLPTLVRRKKDNNILIKENFL